MSPLTPLGFPTSLKDRSHRAVIKSMQIDTEVQTKDDGGKGIRGQVTIFPPPHGLGLIDEQCTFCLPAKGLRRGLVQSRRNWRPVRHKSASIRGVAGGLQRTRI